MKQVTADNYEQVRECLAMLVPFKHSTISAEIVDGTYVVKSYSTVVAKWSPDDSYWITDEKYSVTTSKQVNYIRKAWTQDDS